VLASGTAVSLLLFGISLMLVRSRTLAERASRDLEEANRELEAFSYSVSHDLRAPLRSIEGFSQILLEDYGDKLDEEGEDYLGRVRAASRRMAFLIDDLLDLSRVSRRPLRRELVDLSTQTREIAAELGKSQPEREAEFVIADGLTANGDARLLRLALENLLGNAWKFTSREEKARIEFGSTTLEGRERVYFVRDNGMGFDEAYAGKLFGAFQRLHGPEEFEGTGIGLATVQRIVRRHGGRVWAEGEVGQGATFFFTLDGEPSLPSKKWRAYENCGGNGATES
jgi:light-regulated signal transduction histidine kinase (bacteriophytochrome)